MTPSPPLKGTIMLRSVIWISSHLIAGYLFAYLLDSAFAFYDAKRGRKQFEDALRFVMQEDNYES